MYKKLFREKKKRKENFKFKIKNIACISGSHLLMRNFFLKFIASRCKRDISRKEKENGKEDFFKLATEVDLFQKDYAHRGRYKGLFGEREKKEKIFTTE